MSQWRSSTRNTINADTVSLLEDDDDQTFDDASTWTESIMVAIAPDGTCPLHPHVILIEVSPTDGKVYRQNSCPACDRESKQQRMALKQQRKKLDRQLESLNEQQSETDDDDDDDDQHITTNENHADPPTEALSTSNYNVFSKEAAMTPHQQKYSTDLASSSYRPEPPSQPTSTPTSPLPRPQPGSTLQPKPTTMTVEYLTTQMHMIQTEMVRLLQEKDLELSALRTRVDEQEKQIVFLKAQQHQHQQQQHGPAKTLLVSPAATDIPVSHLTTMATEPVSKSDLTTGKVMNTPMAAEIPSTKDIDFFPKPIPQTRRTIYPDSDSDDDVDHDEIEFNASIRRTPGVMAATAVAASEKASKDIVFVPNDHQSRIPTSRTTHSEKSHATNSESGNDEDDDDDLFNPTIPWAPPGKNIAAVITSGRMRASGKVDPSLTPSTLLYKRNSNDDENNNYITYGYHAKGDFYDDHSVDNSTIGNTVASSTYGDDRQKVMSRILVDQSGCRGLYSGELLLATSMPHGFGKMIYEDGRTYEGDWRHGRWHGFATFTTDNGDSYEGEYRFDQRHGHGKYCWSDGRVYDGEFSDGKRHGKGIFEWPDGDKYTGYFQCGDREGKGRFTFSNGGYYDGSWVQGKYEGFGELLWEDGRRYKGEWQAGMAHGVGIETFADGRLRHEGRWSKNKPIIA